MKKSLIVLLVLALICALCLAGTVAEAEESAETYSGTCGPEGSEDSVTWTLESGTLTISGAGPMGDFSYDKGSPWEPYRDAITSIVLEDGVTAIDEFAFDDCAGLTSVAIPDGVTKIEWGAFDGCSGLTDVYYSGNETQWGAVSIAKYNTPLENATIYYSSFGSIGDGEKLRWERTDETEITFTTPIPEGEMVLVGVYDDAGRLVAVKCVTAEQASAQIGDPARFRFFWVDGGLAPKCSAVTVVN